MCAKFTIAEQCYVLPEQHVRALDKHHARLKLNYAFEFHLVTYIYVTRLSYRGKLLFDESSIHIVVNFSIIVTIFQYIIINILLCLIYFHYLL